MDAESADVPAQSLINEIATFLVATATVLRETVMRFERTTACITENMTTRPGNTDRKLIVTLQDFDRLQQEFVTLGEVLTRAAAKSSESWLRVRGGSHPAEDAIAAISIADVKERFMRHLNCFPLMDAPIAPKGDEAVF